MGSTPTLGLPYPELSDTADVPRDIKALAEAIDTEVVPTGVIQMWPGATAPTGWYLLNGTAVAPAATNPRLAALFGQSGGNVTLPNLSGRALVGAGLLPGAAGPRAVGLKDTGGVAEVTLTTAQIPAHAHPSLLSGSLTSYTSNIAEAMHGVGALSPSTGQGIGPTGASSTGGGTQHENMPPYYGINYICKAG